MKRIIIICEGQTEQEYCKNVLVPHFSTKEIEIYAPRIKKTGGGIVNWDALKHQITTTLKQDKTAIVTTLVDYYKLPTSYPNWEFAHKSKDKNEGLNTIENGMKIGIDENLQHRFYPYIQLHEFEALLFINVEVFDNYYEPTAFKNRDYLVETINKHSSNPELINDSPETAPSKRLEKKIFQDKKYNKVSHFTDLAKDIGLQTIRSKCPRFNAWLTKLEKV